jgi:hypothetical protein
VSQPVEIRFGLWRWTAPHPEWRPGARSESADDWPREVGSVLFEAADATVLIDPLVAAAGDRAFMGWLDRRIQGRRLPVTILTTIQFHRRSRDQLVERYRASTSRARKRLPDGVEAIPIRGAGETMFWLAGQRTLIPGDRIIGAAGGGLRVCPESWLRYLPSRLGVAGLRDRLRGLLELPLESVLVSHGQPVLRRGRAALAKALEG